MCQSTTSRALNSMFLSRSQDYFVSVHLWRTALQLGLKTIRINPVPLCPNFYILPAHFRIFRQIWNWYKIRDVKFEKGAEMVWLVSRSFSYFPGYPIFINSVCTVFITMCVAMAMNLLNHLSVDLWVATIYYTTKCMTVNLFVKLWIIIMIYNYRVIITCLLFSFTHVRFVGWLGMVRVGVFPFWLFIDRSFSTHIRSNWFVFDIWWVYSFSPLFSILLSY